MGWSHVSLSSGSATPDPLGSVPGDSSLPPRALGLDVPSGPLSQVLPGEQESPISPWGASSLQWAVVRNPQQSDTSLISPVKCWGWGLWMNQSCCTRSVLSVTLAAALRITSQFITTFSVIWISRFKNEMQGMKQKKVFALPLNKTFAILRCIAKLLG